jgi:hypothetical protein
MRMTACKVMRGGGIHSVRCRSLGAMTNLRESLQGTYERIVADWDEELTSFP